MAKIIRNFRVTRAVAEKTQKINRSEFLAEAATACLSYPMMLVDALADRVKTQNSDVKDIVRVTVTIEPSLIDKLGELADHTGLSVEAIVRLAAESFAVTKFGK